MKPSCEAHRETKYSKGNDVLDNERDAYVHTDCCMAEAPEHTLSNTNG